MTRVATLVCITLGALAVPSHADSCTVRVVRAPAAIRAEIERWLAGESSCNVPLEVRVVATTGGYYLLARDLHGRVRERIVPDGPSAGVLVASWASDDQLGADEPAPNVPRPAGLDGDDDDDDDAAASTSPVHVATVARDTNVLIAPRAITTVPEPILASKWLRFDVLDNLAGTGGTGLRSELDLWQRDGWSLGVGVAFAFSQQSSALTYAMTNYTDLDFDGLVDLAKTVEVRTGLHVRGALGAGLRVTHAGVSNFEYDALDNPVSAGTTMARAIAQASLLAAAALGHDWAFDFGVLVTGATASHGELVPMNGQPVDILDVPAAIGVQLFGGLACRL